MNQQRQFPRRERREAGAPPGQVIPSQIAVPPVIDVVAYGPDSFVEQPAASLADAATLVGRHPVVWVNVCGLGSAETITGLGAAFGLHQLALEDVVNTHQRPKVEEYGGHLFIVLRMLEREVAAGSEQLAVFLGRDFLVTFQEAADDRLAGVRERLRAGKGRIRSAGADYLCYAVIDSVIDGYFPALEQLGERLERLENRVVERVAAAQITDIHDMKRSLLMLRRAIWPHREMLNDLIRDEHALIAPETRPFVRDCYDHTIQLMDMVETYRDIASGLLDVYISSVSARLNEIMKVLTIVSTIFMPLSFIASLYGMNFDRAASPLNMPELGWYYGYPFALALMVVSASLLMLYFYAKGFLFNGMERRKKKKKKLKGEDGGQAS